MEQPHRGPSQEPIARDGVNANGTSSGYEPPPDPGYEPPVGPGYQPSAEPGYEASAAPYEPDPGYGLEAGYPAPAAEEQPRWPAPEGQDQEGWPAPDAEVTPGPGPGGAHAPLAGQPSQPAPAPGAMTRRDIYTQPIQAGRPVGTAARALAWLRTKLSTELQRREWAVDEVLAGIAPMSRPNTIAVVSPKGGVGKTTVTYLLGNLLASQLKLRVVALDANPDFGTLASLAPDNLRTLRSLADLLADHTEIESPAELHPYVSRLPTGLHLLGAPAHAEVMAQMTPGLYARLLDFLERFYEVVLLDLGTGITDPLAQFAVERADQSVVITTPEWITAAGVLGALRYLQLEEGTLVLNQAPKRRSAGNREVIEQNFRRQAVATKATIPYDDRLRMMLDTGTYDLPRLSRSTRVPIKELAAAVATNFV